MQRDHVIIATVLGLHLGYSLPCQYYYLLSNFTVLTESGDFPPRLSGKQRRT